MGIHFAFKFFLLHLLVVLSSNGSEGAREKISKSNNVLRLPSDHVQASPSSHMNHLDQSMMVFFTLDDLKIGKKLQIYFPMKDSSSTPPMLPKAEADSIPFSYKDFPYLLKLFSISPNSPQAIAMENTLKECELKPIKGETKICATSLESIVDFVRETFGLGTKFKILTTTHLIKSKTLLDNYTIMQEPKEIPVPKMVACHTMPYRYTVFYCHSQQTENKVFVVSLKGRNGGRVEAVAVCHMDTSKWSSRHASFRVLGIKPGTIPVCHFFKGDNLIYVPLPAHG
ncbi:BURP domain-containing protein BNM2A [Jatropha curcas]|nr:BURP domain-containing protein BNM2A [Jatropha curcas]